MSPLAENALCVKFRDSPFHEFFKKGLVVALSTDSPRSLHLTSEPLLEEFAIGSQLWRLRPADQAELCRNSVLLSGFPDASKVEWLGQKFFLRGTKGNNPSLSAVPPMRAIFREDALRDERAFIEQSAGETAHFLDSNY